MFSSTTKLAFLAATLATATLLQGTVDGRLVEQSRLVEVYSTHGGLQEKRAGRRSLLQLFGEQ